MGYIPVDELPDNSLRSNRLVFAISCSGGADAVSGITDDLVKSNLVGVMYRRGGHVVCSYTEITTVAIPWLEAFFEASLDGKTIYESMVAADDMMYSEQALAATDYGNVNMRHIMGDTNVCLFPGGG